MSLKKKLGLGAASAALGLSLIGGGTFAYFNDVATVNNQFAAGTLNLDVNKDGEGAINFDLRNLKPGDTAKRYFILANDGSLSIKDVLAEITASEFASGKAGDSTQTQFLSQFKVDFFRVQNPETQPVWNDRANLIAGNVSLADLVAKTYTNITPGYVVDNRLNLAPTGLPVGDSDGIGIQITFVDNGNQNIYQGDSVKVQFNLEARQEAGVELKTNGFIDTNGNHPSTPASTSNSDGKDINNLTDDIDNPKE
jgi:spore coat-associated protein N